jgi:hypothetical protein
VAKRTSRHGEAAGRSRPAHGPGSSTRSTAGSPTETVNRSGPRLSRGLLFAALAAASLVVAVAYVSWAAIRTQTNSATAPPQATPGQSVAPPSAQPAPSGSAPALAGRQLIFQNVVRDEDYAKVAVVPMDDPQGPRVATALTCERVYRAAGRGLCLVPEGGLIARYWAVLFDEDFVERSRIELVGSPSRARVSADGRYGATTVFVFGHSYADAAFSTQTTIIDMASATTIGELEQFSVYRDETEIFSPDFNFWGVTFAADSNVFYATLRTEGQTYLVKGDVAAREVRILHDNVECPSLSPDGTRIAYKKRVGELGDWRFTVLDLATMQETPLAETESVDDQLEWADDHQLIYGKSGNLWIMPSDGSGTPALLVRDALSPSIGL